MNLIKKRDKEMQYLADQLITQAISEEEFSKRCDSIDKKYDVLLQEKILVGIKYGIYFGIFAVLITAFSSFMNLISGNTYPFIFNSSLAIFNLVNLIVNIKKFNKLKIKLIKDCLT